MKSFKKTPQHSKLTAEIAFKCLYKKIFKILQKTVEKQHKVATDIFLKHFCLISI